MIDRKLLSRGTIGAIASGASALAVGNIASTVVLLRPLVLLSPVFGGAVTAVLHGGDNTDALRAGAVAGVLLASLFVLAVVPAFLFTMVHPPMTPDEPLVEIVKILAVLLYLVGFSTAGGLSGRVLRRHLPR